MISFSLLTATLRDLSPMEGGTTWVKCEGVLAFGLQSNKFFDTAARRQQHLELGLAQELILPGWERPVGSSNLEQRFRWLFVATVRFEVGQMRQGLTHSTVGPDPPFGIEEPTSFLTFPKFDGGAQFAGGWRNWQSPWSPKEVFHLRWSRKGSWRCDWHD